MNVLIGTVILIGTFCLTQGLYSSGSDVVDLTDANFNKLVEQSDSIWIVEFYAPWCGHCKSLAPEYQKAATALKGIIKVGGINCDNEKSLPGRFGVRGFPTIKIFGIDKNKPDDYNGARNAQGLVDEALSVASRAAKASLSGKRTGGSSKPREPQEGLGNDVVILTDENFASLVYDSKDYWLVEFFAPGCGFCERLKPEWAEAATSLKGRIKMGAMDATTQHMIPKEFDVNGYPTIKWFNPGAGGRQDAEDYDGGRTSSEIINWVVSKIQANTPPPEAVELTDRSVLKDQCHNSPLCVIAVLPHLLDCQSSCRNNYLEMLKKTADKYKMKLWGWVWAEAGIQQDLESKLDIGGFGYPAMAVLNSKKMKFSLLRGAFSADGINEFLRDLSFGRGQTRDIRGGQLPDIVKTESWNGEDLALQEEEEDIDLSDVVLDDIKDEL